jgi:xanthine dehydrogenase accessory factor
MRERRKIVELWRGGKAAALVTLVRVEGSSYRRVGARLLVGVNGEYAGSISGGCLEAEVVRKAAWMTRGGAVVERYSTLFDDTAEIPYGLGCGGTVDLLMEPADTPEFEALMEALEASLRGEARRVVTSLPEDGLPLRRVVGDEACEGIEEWIEAPQRMYVFGAGDDAQPMVEMAALMGWDVTVVDGRKQWARTERFPEAVRVIAAASFEGLDGLEIGARDAAVVMTHSYEQDRMWLAGLLRRGPRYLGLLGARHRSALIASETAVALGWSVERVCTGLFAPVGLDLGGDGAVAIALAVVAEVQACCEGKLGASQRMTAAMVAEQVLKGGASRYLQAQCSL